MEGPARRLAARLPLTFALAMAACQLAPEPSMRQRVAGPQPEASQRAEFSKPAPRTARNTPRTESDEPWRDLSVDEGRGGHTLARHVGRSDDELRARLVTERISAASSYTDRDTAERIVGATLERSGGRIDGWLMRTGSRPNVTLRYRGSTAEEIGRSVVSRAGAAVACVDALVVLRWDQRRQDYFVLTSYPEAR